MIMLAASCGQKQSKTIEVKEEKIDILSWPNMPVDEFGCMMEKTFGHRDERFNCSLKDYKNHGDPCDNTDEYYEGPEFPENLVRKVHPWIKTINLSWEGGRLQDVWFIFDKKYTEEQILSEFKINPDSLPDNINNINVQEGSLSLEAFMHMGAGDVDCGDEEDEESATPPPAGIVGTWKTPVKRGNVAYLEIFANGKAGLYLGDNESDQLYEIYRGAVLSVDESPNGIALELDLRLNWYIYESDGSPITGVPDTYKGVYTFRYEQQGGKQTLHVKAGNEATPLYGKKELKMERILKTEESGFMKENEEDTYGQMAGEAIKVSTSLEFIKALGSDRIIELAPGKYLLSEWDPYIPDSEKGEKQKLPHGVSWEDVFDGGELVITGIKNLTIRGLGDSRNTEIIVKPRYAFVLRFENCTGIVIEGLSAGHTVGGYCSGGVFKFANSSQITISNTGMYGCGTEGLLLSDVSGMKVTDSRIYECTYDIMTVENGKNITFEKCVFNDNKEFTLVSVNKTRNLSFTNCQFNNNQGDAMFYVIGTTISVSSSTFSDNKVGKSIANSSNVEFSDCSFK